MVSAYILPRRKQQRNEFAACKLSPKSFFLTQQNKAYIGFHKKKMMTWKQ